MCLALNTALFVGAAEGAPTGRAWSPTEPIAIPGYTGVYAPLFGSGPGDIPDVYFAVAQVGGENHMVAARWRDSTWAKSWDYSSDAGYLWPVISDDKKTYLLWIEYKFVPDHSGSYRLLFAEASGGGLGAVDTVAYVYPGTTQYAGTVVNGVRWVAVSDNAPARLRVLRSTQFDSWEEYTAEGGLGTVAIAPLSDTTALVAQGRFGVTFGISAPHIWTPSPPPTGDYGEGPRFGRKTGGDWWLTYGSNAERVYLLEAAGSTRTLLDSIGCATHPNAPYVLASGPFLTDEGDSLPAMTWIYVTDVEVFVCAAIPENGAYSMGDEMQDGETDGASTIVRDSLGDVWVGWWRYADGTLFTHTYTHATTSRPSLAGSITTPILRARLSEPAPRSWWSVLRATGDGAFEPVARLQAGADTTLAFSDTTAPPGVLLRYRFLRECVDKRYQWLSEEAAWWPRAAKLELWLKTPNPAQGGIEAAVLGGQSGALDVRLYDLQGRLAFRIRPEASGSGSDLVRLDLNSAAEPIRSGIYFLKVLDSAGRVSNSLKVAVVR